MSDVEIIQAFLTAWLNLYAHAARNIDDPFWAGFLNPFWF